MLGLQLLFRSVNKLLMDTATSEYLFCFDFFQEAAVFHELFAPTLQVVESALAATLPVSCIMLNHAVVLYCVVPCRAIPCCLLLCFGIPCSVLVFCAVS